MTDAARPTGTRGSLPRGGSLLERERELASLDELIQRAVERDAAVCVLEGPAGIGKTRLIAEARLRATAEGMRVLSASASELEREFGFGIVGQLFERTVRDDPVSLLSGAATPAYPIVGPERRQEPSEQAADPSFASLTGLYWLTVRLSEQRPLLLAIDDLQWCDVHSLRFLAFLASRFNGLPLLVVCGVRSTEPAADPAVLDAIVDGSATVRLRPQALSDAAAATLIERRLATVPDPAFATACHRATGGNPLLLEELVRALADEGASPVDAHLALLKDLGPESVARTVLLRLRRLGTDATAAAQALAVLGDGTDLATVAAHAGLTVDRAGQGMSTLARAEIVRAELPLGFVHPVVAAAVYRDVPPGELELRHLRAAELLAAASAPSEQVAGHLLPAPTRGAGWVVEQLAGAAADALAKGAPDSAVAYLQRALAEPPELTRRADLSLALGRAATPRNGAIAVEPLRAAYSLLTDPEQRAIVAELLGRVLLFTGEGDEAVRMAQEAAAALPSRHKGLRQQLEALELFCVMFGAGDPTALRRLEAHRTTPVAAGVGAKMLAAIAAQAWMYACGPSDAVSELSRAALSGGKLLAQDLGWAVTFPITNLTYADREEAEGWWESANATAHRHGSLLDISAITEWRGNALHQRGELADAEQSLRECRDVVRQWGYDETVTQTYTDAHLASVLRDRGDLAGARRALNCSADLGRDDEGTRKWLGSRLQLLLAEKSYQPTIEAADDYARRFDHIVRNPMDAPWRSIKALALDRLGRRDEALELVQAELALARAWGAPGTVCRTLRALGTIERDEGLGHLEEAVTVVAGSPARLEHAKALAAFGSALRHAQRPSHARAPLRQALAIASVCGADGLAQRTRSELYAAGARPRRTALTGIEALTASERRVVEHAAEGRTNREVGEALFITPKTVAMHLSNAYRKLAITSRLELAAALADAGAPSAGT